MNNDTTTNAKSLYPTRYITTQDFNPWAKAMMMRKEEQPLEAHEISTRDFLNMFEVGESLEMAYIPHFVTQCIMHYIDHFADFCRDWRISEYKKHSRILRAVKTEYMQALRKEMPAKIYQKFLDQREDYLSSCERYFTLMYFTFANELCRKYLHIENETPICYANIMLALIHYLFEFDKHVNAKITERTGRPCVNRHDYRLDAIADVCNDVIRAYPLEESQDTVICINTLVSIAKKKIIELAN